VTNQLNEMNKVMLQFSDKTMQEVQRIINFYPEGKQKSALIPVLHMEVMK